MNFYIFYKQLISDRASLLDRLPPSHAFFNRTFNFRKRKVNILKILCQNRCKKIFASITKKDPSGSFIYPFINRPKVINATMLAALKNSDLFFLKRLIEIGADTKLLLHQAYIHCSNQRIHEIIDNFGSAIDINIADEDGKTPLMLAAQSGDHEAVSKLLALGADPDLYCYRNSMSAYDYADTCNKQTCMDILWPRTKGYLDVSQGVILEKIVCFLKLQSELDPVHYPPKDIKEKIKSIERVDGICAGLSAIFSLKNRQGKLNEFNSNIKTICAWEGKTLDRELESIFFDFVQAVLCMQGYNFLHSFDPYMQDWAFQYQFITPYKIKNEVNIGAYFDKDRLKDIFEAIDFINRLIHIDYTFHRISITKRDNKYIVYECNDPSGLRKFEKTEDLLNYITPDPYNAKSIGICIFSLEMDQLSQPESLLSQLDIVSQHFAKYGAHKTKVFLNKVDFGNIERMDCSILSTAAFYNDIKTIKDIIKFRHLVNMQLKANRNAIIAASQFSRPNIISLLLDNFRFSKKDLVKAFSFIIERSLFSLIHKFANAGLLMNRQSINGIHIGEAVCFSGSYEDFQVLVRHGYRPNPNNYSLLLNAFKNLGISFVISLIDSGHVNIDATCSLGSTFSDHLLSKGFLDDFERLTPYGAKPVTLNINQERFICKIYEEHGISGLEKLTSLFPDINIQDSPKLLYLAAQNKDTAALHYLKANNVNNDQYLLDRIDIIYKTHGAKYIIYLQAAEIIDLNNSTIDIISVAIANRAPSKDIKYFLNNGLKIHASSIARNISILSNRGCFSQAKVLAAHATAQGVSVITDCRIIFSLLKSRQGMELVKHLLETNIFHDNYSYVLAPVLESSTKRGFYKTIAMILNSVPKDTLQPLINQMLLLSLQRGDNRMVSLYLSYGADPNPMVRIRTTREVVRLSSLAAMQKGDSTVRKKLYDLSGQPQDYSFLGQQIIHYVVIRREGMIQRRRTISSYTSPTRAGYDLYR